METQEKTYNLKNDQKIKRKNIRLKEYDYAERGYYFIIICTKNRECILSEIKEYNSCRGEHCSSDLINKLTKIGKNI